MSTENIVKFLETAYSDEKLAALLAHAQDGKLGFYSCCCLVGTATAMHALVAAPKDRNVTGDEHLSIARQLPYAYAAESEFSHLGKTDVERRKLLIPLILAEIERRELTAQYRMEEEAAAEEGAAIEASGYPDPGSDRRFA